MVVGYLLSLPIWQIEFSVVVVVVGCDALWRLSGDWSK